MKGDGGEEEKEIAEYAEEKWTPRKIETLFDADIHKLGEIADKINRREGNIVTFVVNKHINYTNVCVAKCPLCAFYRDAGDSDAYLMTVEEVLAEAEDAIRRGGTELHIVGSLNPEVSIEYFEEMFSRIKELARMKKRNVVVKALTAVEVDFIAKKERMSIKETLSRLKSAGLDAMPGGGAEILVDEIRKMICPNKANAEKWLKVMEIAHKLGIKSNATMLFGHIEQIRHRALHIFKLWNLQNRTKGFISFIPLLFHPENTRIGYEKGLRKADPIDILKTIAVSRIVLRNFKSVRAYWIGLGEKLTQIALNYGANDIDGTIMGERVTHSAGAKSPTHLTVRKILGIIRASGKIPAERDTFYNILRVFA